MKTRPGWRASVATSWNSVGREIDRCACPGNRQAIGVEDQIAEAELRAASLVSAARRAPQHGLHPRDELTRAEWLGDVVVGARLEAEKPVRLPRRGPSP